LEKPIVDRLERDLVGKTEVVRIDVLSKMGRQVAARYGVRGLPTLLVVDGQGEVTLTQIGFIKPGGVKNEVNKLIAQTVD